MDDVWRYLRQRHQNKAAFMEPRVGDGQLFPGQDEVAEEKNVQVHGARPPSDRSFPFEYPGLYPLQLFKKPIRRKRGFESQDRVQEALLFYGADRLRFVETGERRDPRGCQFADFGYCPEEVKFAVPLVRAESYENI